MLSITAAIPAILLLLLGSTTFGAPAAELNEGEDVLGDSLPQIKRPADANDLLSSTTNIHRRDIPSRQETIELWNKEYLASERISSGWTGSVAGCDPGTISQDFMDATLQRLNFFRVIAGQPPVKLSPVESQYEKCQEASLVFVANQALSHYPATDWACYTGGAYEAASRSNINFMWSTSPNVFRFGSSSGPMSITDFMDDFGSNNRRVGHRAWFLYPGLHSIAVGSAGPDSAVTTGRYVEGGAIWVSSPNFDWVGASEYAFPSMNGYWPYQILPTSYRWSFTRTNTNFLAADVSVTLPSGETISPTIDHAAEASNGLPESSVVFLVQLEQSPEAVGVYTVKISGVAGGEIMYTVTVIDPDEEDTTTNSASTTAATSSLGTTVGTTAATSSLGTTAKTTAVSSSVKSPATTPATLSSAATSVATSSSAATTSAATTSAATTSAATTSAATTSAATTSAAVTNDSSLSIDDDLGSDMGSFSAKIALAGENGGDQDFSPLCISSSTNDYTATWSPPGTGFYTMNEKSDIGAVGTVRLLSDPENEVACGETITFAADAEEKYIISFAGKKESVGKIKMKLKSCGSKIDKDIGSVAGGTLASPTLTLPSEDDNVDFSPSCAESSTTEKAYLWKAPSSGRYQFKISTKTEGKGVITIRDGSCGKKERECGRKVTLNAKEGKNYVITVHGQGTDVGKFKLKVKTL